MHYHHCPNCYEKKSCEMPCSIEPDLDDPVYDPGKQFGAHCICDDCKNVKKTELNKEWWLKYNGYTKVKRA